MELQRIHTKIHTIRGYKIMLDFDLAELYETETRRLKEAVRRNIERFPADFMFELTRDEYNTLRSQIATLEVGRGKYSKYLPFGFTEQGVAMLSSVLNSPKAIQVNIAIMRAFVELRRYAVTYLEMAEMLQAHDTHLKDIEEVLAFLAEENQKRAEEIEAMKTGGKHADGWQERSPIGFKK